ncbi:MAG: 1-acyl-sn-glycerol-3-phosphate acyltransferase [Planctomycetota bacterium]|nr:MAG: 1-acyl-sn-glycerol-3-phosphate acyltransferase [Planctomycetota bacterium]
MIRPRSVEEPRLNRLFKIAFYYSLQLVCRLACVSLFHLRCLGREHTRVAGPALILSTHQSHLDPILVGVAFNERVNSVARQSLFPIPVLGTVIRWLDAIALDRTRGGLGGLKETMRRLRAGRKVLLFPEGTRTPTGRMLPLKPGFLVLARKCSVPLIPMAIVGAYDALPRGTWVLRPVPIRVVIGPAIEPDELKGLDDAAALELVTNRLAACRQRGQRR